MAEQIKTIHENVKYLTPSYTNYKEKPNKKRSMNIFQVGYLILIYLYLF